MSALTERQSLMTPERFASGLTYEDYKSLMTKNRDRFEAHERTNIIPDADVAAFRSLRRRLHAAVLTEDWCSDAVATLPLLDALAKRSGAVDVRIFYRDQNLDLMDAHLKRGKFRSIPTFIFYDEAWNEVGAWLEKPAVIDELRARLRLEIYASDPAFGSPDASFADLPDDVRERYNAAYWKMRDETTPLCNSETLRELRELLLGSAA
jgi:hypothetical protein